MGRGKGQGWGSGGVRVSFSGLLLMLLSEEVEICVASGIAEPGGLAEGLGIVEVMLDGVVVFGAVGKAP